MLQRIRMWALSTTNPIIQRVSAIKFPISNERRKLSAENKTEISQKLDIGYVLVSFSRGVLSNFLIPGKWSHGAMYIGDGDIIEAVGSGVRITSLDEFFKGVDYIAVCRPKFAEAAEVRSNAVEVARAQEGKPYDNVFDWQYSNQTAFYCFELIVWSYFQVIAEMPFKLKIVWGEETVLGDDFVRATQHYEVIFNNKS